MACVTGSWGIACGLLALNAAICLVAAILAGWTFNKEMDYAWSDLAFGGSCFYFDKFFFCHLMAGRRCFLVKSGRLTLTFTSCGQVREALECQEIFVTGRRNQYFIPFFRIFNFVSDCIEFCVYVDFKESVYKLSVHMRRLKNVKKRFKLLLLSKGLEKENVLFRRNQARGTTDEGSR